VISVPPHSRYFFTLKMEATRSSETSVYNKPTQRQIPEGSILYNLASMSFTEEHASSRRHQRRASSPSSLPSGNAASQLQEHLPGHHKHEPISPAAALPVLT
jgi:hypothetical protein